MNVGWFPGTLEVIVGDDLPLGVCALMHARTSIRAIAKALSFKTRTVHSSPSASLQPHRYSFPSEAKNLLNLDLRVRGDIRTETANEK